MKSTADTYYNAALEHLNFAQWLWTQDRFHQSHYYSGLAVECILRAYLLRITSEWESRHDLYKLAKESHFFDVVPSELQADYGAKLCTLNERWNSNHGYFSARQIFSHWNDLQAEFRAKGDRDKNIGRVALNTAQDFVNLGVRSW